MIGMVEADTILRVYRRLIPLIFAMMFLHLDHINIGAAALDMNRQLGFTPAVFGFAGRIFFGSMLLEVPRNRLLHGVVAWISS